VKVSKPAQPTSAAQASLPTRGGRLTTGGSLPTVTPARFRDLIMIGAGLLVIALDQWTKHLIVNYFITPGYRAPVPIVGQVLTLDYVQNTGVAFSMFEGQSIQFLFIAIAIGVIGYLYWRFRDRASLALKLNFGLVLGGATGNLIDRFRQGFVVDFIHFQLPAIGFNFAVFNVADSSICIGVLAIAVLLYFTTGQDEAQAKQGATEPQARPSSAASLSRPATAPTGAPKPLTSAATNTANSGGKAKPAPSGAAPRVRRKVTGDQRRG